MALPFFSWSRTAASNATADSTVNWAEGQAPSSVNDSARAMMASIAGYRDDTAGAITTGGAATAYTVTSYQVFSSLALMANQVIAFVPHATNTNAVGVDVTLNVDGLGAKSIRLQPSVALPNGSLVLGTPYAVIYNNSDAVFYLKGISTNPYNIPLGGGMDYWGTTVPNTSFAFPIGQQISQTTYATLYAKFGANAYGADGGGLFFLPDKTGRVSAMKESSGTRLTTALSGVDGGTMGSAAGNQNQNVAQNQLPNVTLAYTNSIGVNSNVTNVLQGTLGVVNSGAGASFSGVVTAGSSSSVLTSTGTSAGSTASINGGVTQAGLINVQPTIVCQYIIRII